MANILFASNNVAHFPGASTGADNTRFDAARVPYSIRLTNYQQVSSPVFQQTTGDDTWFHFRTHWYNVKYNFTGTWFTAFDAANNTLFTIQKRNATYSSDPRLILYDGSTSLTDDGSLALPDDLISSIDIRFRQTSLVIECDMYVNGGLSCSLAFASNPNGRGHPVRFQLGAGIVDNLTDSQDFSEILVADADTRNARLDLLRPQAAGAYEQWDGQLATLADDDSTSGMTTIDADQRQTMTMTPYGGAPNISNVVAVSTTTRGQNSPTQLQHTVRLSGVDYDGVAHDVDFALEYHITDFKINPATSLAWDETDVAAVEVGFVSRA